MRHHFTSGVFRVGARSSGAPIAHEPDRPHYLTDQTSALALETALDAKGRLSGRVCGVKGD